MPKFFVPKENIKDGYITVSGADVLHIRKVLRMDKGDEISLCDGKGMNYRAVISDIGKDTLICEIKDSRKAETEPPISVTLYQGIPKAQKMEYVIQKTTELGICRIVPVVMARCVVRLDEKDALKKRERWQKIALEAAKQSGRGMIPEVSGPLAFSDALEEMKKNDICFIPYECEEERRIREVLSGNKNALSAAFMIGPEGGFDLDEVSEISEKGIPTVTLGKRILRTETAGEAVLAMIMYELGDINR